MWALESKSGSFVYWAISKDKSFNLFVLQFPHFQNGGNCSRLGGLKKVTYIKLIAMPAS